MRDIDGFERAWVRAQRRLYRYFDGPNGTVIVQRPDNPARKTDISRPRNFPGGLYEQYGGPTSPAGKKRAQYTFLAKASAPKILVIKHIIILKNSDPEARCPESLRPDVHCYS
jgi:hypothetical protein